MRIPAFAAFLLLAMSPLASAAILGLPIGSPLGPPVALPLGLPSEGPDVPASSDADAVVDVFVDEAFSYTESARTVTIQVPAAPDGAWDRIGMTFDSRPEGDPWDRLFSVAVAGVEVLRGTTPRTQFTIDRDITEYGSLLPSGGVADVSLLLSTWVGAIRGSVTLQFFDGEKTKHLVESAASAAVPAGLWRYLGGDGAAATQSASFPATPASKATLVLTTSGHGNEEFWYMGPFEKRTLSVRVDGVEVGQAVMMPYTYALLGFDPAPVKLHTLMWWTAQRGLDLGGIHAGVGEIPAYRVQIDADKLPLLTGARNVEVAQTGGLGTWITSVAFLLD